MSTLRLILGDQLNIRHSWFSQIERERDDVLYVLMELRSETDYAHHHAQKVLGIFAAMRGFAQALQQAGCRVRYIKIGDTDNRQDFIGNLSDLIASEQITQLERQQADEYRLESQFQAAESELGILVKVVDSEHFLADRAVISTQFAQKIPRMEFFYRALRKQYQILLDADGQPLGGQWNFDQDNRKRWTGQPAAPQWPNYAADLRDLWGEIVSAGVKTLGQPRAESFPWPITRTQAKDALSTFIANALPNFGAYQDAMSTASPTLFHAGLSFALNLKLLHPLEVIHAALAEFAAGRVSIATVEGFVRQILGWREFVRGVYWARMPAYGQLNALEHQRSLPSWYWNGQTKMNCLKHAIAQSLELGYAHHIQRLMVTGNFALLAGILPDEVDAWYLGIYVDAFEWVEMPNTRGMSQYADGGLLGSKPYAGSASYINKMSDYCKGCHYEPKQRHGEGACPFNSLYWHFHHRHAATLEKNPRLGMTYQTWRKMADDEKSATLAQAERYLSQLDNL
ncbi:cryptochrome/photolyase family protein [Chitinibacter bivalviorum]|uniref:Cryptochrome/photolyase family protein n=1 Tax=Chitinibacter bivalviorum TaxID=2739434 RepID=A0A7H9BH42_9NEIS|nr:cryptochrome/photolyase family protein [Chitinibacter bivalviorum]QLG88043.1 cryptochrome/photolyase family protein [Chitinibacter bivalviorum]